MVQVSADTEFIKIVTTPGTKVGGAKVGGGAGGAWWVEGLQSKFPRREKPLGRFRSNASLAGNKKYLKDHKFSFDKSEIHLTNLRSFHTVHDNAM